MQVVGNAVREREKKKEKKAVMFSGEMEERDDLYEQVLS